MKKTVGMKKALLASVAWVAALGGSMPAAHAQTAAKPVALAEKPAGAAGAAVQVNGLARANDDQVVLLRGPAGQVTLADVRAMAWVVLPAEQHASMLGRKTGLEQLALAVYTQMALANQAGQTGLAKEVEFRRAQELAARRTLSEIWMAHQADVQGPTTEQAEQYARTQFEQEKQARAGKTRVHVRHLLVRASEAVGRTDAQALAQAQALLARVKAGESFADLATRLSDDKASAPRGGELAAFEEGRMVPEFEQAAFALEKPGQLGGPVKTRFGYHLIELIDKKAGESLRFEDVKKQMVEETLQQRRQQIRREVWEAAQKGMAYEEAAIDALVQAASVSSAAEAKP